ncbi:N(4)-(beta-N-acetylglucosaminyl)-L-asparaginase [bacterium]|nr:N(4)-(beta-N-acetylglucosaminyl)-L-asparaginase [bacterium]
MKRRDFIRNSALSTAALAIAPHNQTRERNIPILVCSRGEEWAAKILQPGWQTWLDKKNMLDAVEAAANVVELDPEDTSVGYGGLPNEDGVVELDASVMSGPLHRCGAVAGLRNIKRACSVARLVMERSNHSMLVGDGARRFALAHGFKEEDLLTDKARETWLRWKEDLNKDDFWGAPDARPTGTINVLGVDDQGDVFGITTTSGLAFKIPGRIGDSPIIGAGLYVDNTIGAAGATGRGEEVIRTCGCFLVVEKMRQGLSPQQACEFGCRRILEVNQKVNFNVKFIAVNKNGEVGSAQLQDRKKSECSFITAMGIKSIFSAVVK